jgi:ferredoxin
MWVEKEVPMDPRREQLIALLLGDLEQDDAMGLEARLAGDAALQRERDTLERHLTAIRALPDDDLPQAAVDRVVAAAAEFNAAPQATFGICGTCKVRKTAGAVHMVHNGGISDDDVEEGFILACCSNPIGKVSIQA